MKDGLGRNIDYMRISITDRCNLRCRYCMPDGIEWRPMSEILTLEEIHETVKAASGLGIRKIKVTGGEPLVRKGCSALVEMLKSVPGIEEVTLTTNGILLAAQLDGLLKAGVDGINISLDTVNPDLYRAITGGGDISGVFESLKRLMEAAGAPNDGEREKAPAKIPVKINAVSMDLKAVAAHLNCPYEGDGWMELLAIARDYPVDVRFIEMMPIGFGREFPGLNHEKMMEQLRTAYPKLEKDERRHGNGPAVYYRIPGFMGSVGFISAIHGKFCDSCNRVRLTSTGYLKSCLSFHDGVDLRRILREEKDDEKREKALMEAMSQAILKKPAAHCFEHPENMTEQHDMVQIGG